MLVLLLADARPSTTKEIQVHGTAWALLLEKPQVSGTGLVFQWLAVSLSLLLDIPVLTSCFSLFLQKQNKRVLLSTVP